MSSPGDRDSSPLEPPPSQEGSPQTPQKKSSTSTVGRDALSSAYQRASISTPALTFRRESNTNATRQMLEPPPSSSVLPPRRESAAAEVLRGVIRLRVAGLGHYFELDSAPTVTLGDLKEEIEKKTDLPSPYQRLVAKRKKMDDDTMVLGPTIMDGNTIISMGIGLEDRTKILLLHSSLFAKDEEGIDKLTKLIERIDEIDAGRRSRDIDNKTVQEFIIQVMCKIDCVETNGSEALRKMRKLTIRKAEEVAHKSEADKRGLDPWFEEWVNR